MKIYYNTINVICEAFVNQFKDSIIASTLKSSLKTFLINDRLKIQKSSRQRGDIHRNLTSRNYFSCLLCHSSTVNKNVIGIYVVKKTKLVEKMRKENSRDIEPFLYEKRAPIETRRI